MQHVAVNMRTVLGYEITRIQEARQYDVLRLRSRSSPTFFRSAALACAAPPSDGYLPTTEQADKKEFVF